MTVVAKSLNIEQNTGEDVYCTLKIIQYCASDSGRNFIQLQTSKDESSDDKLHSHSDRKSYFHEFYAPCTQILLLKR